MRLEPDLPGLLKALARIYEAVGVKSAGGRVMLATELFLSSLAFIGVSIALVHEMIEAVYSSFRGHDFAFHTLIYVVFFMTFAFVSLVLVFLREWLEWLERGEPRRTKPRNFAK